jgi:hypothetical protein
VTLCATEWSILTVICLPCSIVCTFHPSFLIWYTGCAANSPQLITRSTDYVSQLSCQTNCKPLQVSIIHVLNIVSQSLILCLCCGLNICRRLCWRRSKSSSFYQDNRIILYKGSSGDRSSSPGRVKDFLFFYVVQTGSGVRPTSYPMGTEGTFPGGKVAGAWSWRLISSWCRGQENVHLYIHSPIRLHVVVVN